MSTLPRLLWLVAAALAQNQNANDEHHGNEVFDQILESVSKSKRLDPLQVPEQVSNFGNTFLVPFPGQTRLYNTTLRGLSTVRRKGNCRFQMDKNGLDVLADVGVGALDLDSKAEVMFMGLKPAVDLHVHIDYVRVLLEALHINKFIDKQFENSRLQTEGESVYEEKHFVVCSVKDQNDDEVTLAALVLQTSASSKDPHELEVSIKGREVAAASCTCKAGVDGAVQIRRFVVQELLGFALRINGLGPLSYMFNFFSTFFTGLFKGLVRSLVEKALSARIKKKLRELKLSF